MLTERTTEPGLVTFYDIRPGNGAGLFLQPRSPHGADGQHSCLYPTVVECNSDHRRTKQLHGVGWREMKDTYADIAALPMSANKIGYRKQIARLR